MPHICRIAGPSFKFPIRRSNYSPPQRQALTRNPIPVTVKPVHIRANLLHAPVETPLRSGSCGEVAAVVQVARAGTGCGRDG